MKHETILRRTGCDPGTRDDSRLSRRTFLKGVGIACLGLAPLLQGCDIAFSREEERSAKGRAASAFPALKPPIDVAAPARTRTATFSLG